MLSRFREGERERERESIYSAQQKVFVIARDQPDESSAHAFSRNYSIPQSMTFIKIDHTGYSTFKKGKIVPVHAMKACRGSRGIAPLILTSALGEGGMVNFTPRPLCPWERILVPIG